MIEQNFTGVRVFDSRYDFDQGGLPGSILTNQTMDLPIANPYTDIVQGAKTPIAFADMIQLQEVLRPRLLQIARH